MRLASCSRRSTAGSPKGLIARPQRSQRVARRVGSMSTPTPQPIADWLEKLGLGQYAQCFAENEIDFSILGDLTDQDLEKIGVAPLGHRRKLLRAIGELSSAQKGTPAVTTEGAAPVAPQSRDAAERRQVTVMFS